MKAALSQLSNDELRAKSTEFKNKIKEARGEKDSKIGALKLEAENTSDIDKKRRHLQRNRCFRKKSI